MTSIMVPNNQIVKRLLAIAFWLFVWQLAAVQIQQKVLIASPWQTLQTLYQLLQSGAFWQRIVFSTGHILLGFLGALAAGVLLACLSAILEVLRILIEPFMQLIKSVPVASFIILALLWVKSANLSTLIVFLMVLPVIYTAVLQGILQTDSQLLEMTKVFRVPFWRVVFAVWIPQTWPYFVQSCTVAIGLAWKSGIAAEVIGLPAKSIGEALYQAKIYLETGELFAWTAVIVAISAGAEYLLLKGFGYLGKQLEGSRE